MPGKEDAVIVADDGFLEYPQRREVDGEGGFIPSVKYIRRRRSTHFSRQLREKAKTAGDRDRQEPATKSCHSPDAGPGDRTAIGRVPVIVISRLLWYHENSAVRFEEGEFGPDGNRESWLPGVSS